MKITRRQLRRLIAEAYKTGMRRGYRMDDDGNLTGQIYKPNLTLRDLPHDIQQKPVPPEFFVPDDILSDPEIGGKIDTFRRSDDIQARRQADQFYDSFADDDTSMLHKDTYADAKVAYDKVYSRKSSPGGFLGAGSQLVGSDGYLDLNVHASDYFKELGSNLESNSHPDHGPVNTTALYDLYKKINFNHIDLERGIQSLENYLKNPNYAADREKLDKVTMRHVHLAVHEMKKIKREAFKEFMRREDDPKI